MKIASTPTKEQTKLFHESLKEEKVNSSRVLGVLGGFLYIVFSIIDYFGLPKETLVIIYTTRAFALLVISAIFYLTFKPIFLKHYNKLLMYGYYCSGIVICIAIYLSKAGEYSYDFYFVALIVLIITSFSWSYLPIRQSIIMSLVFIVAYAFIKVNVHKDYEGVRFLTLLSQIFYLASVGVIAAIAQAIRDSLIYKNIQLQQDLTLIAEEKTSEARKQKKLANMDALTGIPNRRYITEKLRKAIIEVERTHTQLTLIFIDLNGFKSINDDYGHDSGDKVLEVTAKRLQQTIRESDYVARLGGDEFLLGYKTIYKSTKSIKDLSKNLKEKISAPIAFNGNLLQVGVSIGYANYPRDGKNVEELIKAADANMYKDKKNGKAKIMPLKNTLSAS